MIRLGTATVELHGDLTITRLHDGKTIPARPQTDDAYLARAEALGYGGNTLAMSREHEIGHSLLAHVLGLPESPTLRGVAEMRYWPAWRAEEAAVLALAAYARAAGVDLVERAHALAAQG